MVGLTQSLPGRRVLDYLMTFVDLFVPPQHANDTLDRLRSRLVVIMLLLVLGSLPFNIAQQLVRGEWPLLVVSLTSAGVFAAVLWAHRQHPNHARSAYILVVFGWFAVLATAVLTGGLYSSVTPFLAIVPVLALTLVGPRDAIRWFAVCAISLVVLSVAEVSGLRPYQGSQAPLPWTINLLLMMIYMLGLSWFHEELRRVRDAQLKEAVSMADAASQAKDTFMANMSHELRTPMNGVLGMTELLLGDSALPIHYREQLVAIEESGQALVEILNDILDLSKVTAGKLHVEDIAWEPLDMVEAVHRLFVGGAHAKGLQMTMEVGKDVPGAVLGDPMRVRQILCNLVGNAVKFTQQGSVTLEAHADHDHLVFTVRDTGPGIPSHLRERIFQPFTQGDASTARRHGGSGLGLTISQHLAARMGGELVLIERGAVGSQFELRLPLRPTTATPLRTAKGRLPTDGGYLEGMHILIVEDVPVNQAVARGMIEALGCTAEIVADGRMARTRLTSGETWDVVLMDWHLPGLDGIDLTRQVREQGYAGAIVAVSASVRDEDRQRMQASGMDAFVGKPFSRNELRNAMLEALELRLDPE